MFRPSDVASFRRKLDFPDCVDGGVDLETVADVVKAGAESLVAGNAVFGRGYIRGNAAKLLKVVSSIDVN